MQHACMRNQRKQPHRRGQRSLLLSPLLFTHACVLQQHPAAHLEQQPPGPRLSIKLLGHAVAGPPNAHLAHVAGEATGSTSRQLPRFWARGNQLCAWTSRTCACTWRRLQQAWRAAAAGLSPKVGLPLPASGWPAGELCCVHWLLGNGALTVFLTATRRCGAGATGFSAASLAARLARFCWCRLPAATQQLAAQSAPGIQLQL